MKSIQSRLLIMLLVFIILPYFLSVLLIYGQTKENVERHELESSRDQMRQTSEDLEHYFQDMVDLPYILYRNPDLFAIFENGFEGSLYRNQREINKGMATFYLMRSEIKQLRFYMDKGKSSFTVYNSVISYRNRQPAFMQQAPIQKLIKADSSFSIEPPHLIVNYNDTSIIPASDKTMVLTLHHKIRNALSREFLGVITIDIDLSKVARIADHFIQNKGESVLLSDSNGLVVYASDEAMIGGPVPAGLREKLDRPGTSVYSPDGDIILSETLTGPVQDWRLVKLSSSGILFKDARKTAYTNIVVGVVVGLLGLLMIAIISYKITRPIKLLSRKVLSIEGGNMNAPFDDKREDEIGHLEKHIKEMMNRINLHIDREYKLEIENRKNQHRALKSQINPHFLYNSLQSIGTVAMFSGVPQIYRLITSLSKMMRYAIRVEEKSSVRHEIDYVKAYLTLQEERFQAGFGCSIDLPDDVLDITVPSMVLQPLVENFFKHCYEEDGEPASLRISACIRNLNLYLDVENDGCGMTDAEWSALRESVYADSGSSDEHIGLKNIHDRLVLTYGRAAGIELDSIQGTGFRVRLVIPLYLKEDGRYESSYRGR